MAIKIAFLSEVKDFLRGARESEDALGDVADALDDVASEAAKGGDKTSDELKDVGKSADKLENKFEDLAAAAKDTSRTGGKSLGDNYRKGTSEAGEGLDELKDESRSTAKEAAASFDGSAESIIDAFQEVAANAFQGFGPAGLVAGIAVAAGIGTATQAFTANQEAADEAKQKVRDYGLAIIETGNDAAALTYVTDNLKDIVSNSDDAAKKLSDIQKLAKKYPELGGDVAALAKAYAGNADAANLMIQKTKELAAQQVTGKEKSVGLSNAHKKQRDELNGVAAELERVQQETKTAQDIEQQWLASGGQEYLNKAAAIDQVNSAYDDAAGSVQDYLDKETGVFNTENYINAMNAKLTALSEYQTLLANSTLSTSAKTYLTGLGSEAASQLMQAYKNGTAAQKSNLDKIWSEAGKSNSGQYVSGVKNAIPDRIDKSPKVGIDTSAAGSDMTNFINRYQGKTIELNIKGKTITGVRVF